MPTYLSPGVYVEELEAGSRPIEGVSTSVAAFVGLAEKGPLNAPTLVSNWTSFVDKFGGFVTGSYLAHAIYGYFLNGGGNCYVVRIGAETQPSVTTGKPKELPAGQEGALGGYKVTSLPSAPRSKPIRVEVADAGGENPPEDYFKLLVHVEGRPSETFDHVTTKKGDNNVITRMAGHSKLVVLEEVASGSALAKPDKGVVELRTVEPTPEPPSTDNIEVSDYVGDAADRTGFSALEAVDEVSILAVPDLMAAYEQGAIDLDRVKAVQLAMIAHCEMMGDRIAILDSPPGLNPQQVKDWRFDANYDTKFAALYYPYLTVSDPASGRNINVPPSGHMAGVWARNDDTRGVHKAPANEVVRGAVSLETQITKAEHDLLNPVGINCIRSFPGRGVRIWGARTLSSDKAWQYLNIRRYFNYLQSSILLGTQWVVFEPNDRALWARIRRTISAFLVNEWRKGALFGLTADEAYYVKCDDETNPAEAIDIGQVLCQIGVAPVKPAEFVIFQLAQFSGGASLVNE